MGGLEKPTMTSLKTLIDGEPSSRAADVLVRRRIVTCEAIASPRVVLERFSEAERLLVLRVARRPGKPSVPSHFLVLSYSEGEDGVSVDTDPVMVLPTRKGGFERDVRSVESVVA